MILFSSSGTAGSLRAREYPDADETALVLHTSGTTSRPKRVPLSHTNLKISARNIAETYRLTAEDVSLCVMPLFHVHGLVASTLATLLTGGGSPKSSCQTHTVKALSRGHIPHSVALLSRWLSETKLDQAQRSGIREKASPQKIVSRLNA